MRALVRAAERQGWTVVSQSHHHVLTPPGSRRRIAIPVSPNSDAGVRSAIARLRHHGFTWKGR